MYPVLCSLSLPISPARERVVHVCVHSWGQLSPPCRAAWAQTLGSFPLSPLGQRRQVSPAGTSSTCSLSVVPGGPESASWQFQGPIVPSPSPLPGGFHCGCNGPAARSTLSLTHEVWRHLCCADHTPLSRWGSASLQQGGALHCLASWVLPSKSPSLGDKLSQFATRRQNRRALRVLGAVRMGHRCLQGSVMGAGGKVDPSPAPRGLDGAQQPAELRTLPVSLRRVQTQEDGLAPVLLAIESWCSVNSRLEWHFCGSAQYLPVRYGRGWLWWPREAEGPTRGKRGLGGRLPHSPGPGPGSCRKELAWPQKTPLLGSYIPPTTVSRRDQSRG